VQFLGRLVVSQLVVWAVECGRERAEPFTVRYDVGLADPAKRAFQTPCVVYRRRDGATFNHRPHGEERCLHACSQISTDDHLPAPA